MTDNSQIMREQIDLSICIPTFNRARYLNCLLGDFAEKQEEFSFRYELIVSDNASKDETSQVVKRWESTLPIVYVQQKENLGALPNLRDAYSYARGTVSMYLADDDYLHVDGLNTSLKQLLDSPENIALYAPWYVVNLEDKNHPQAPQSFDLSQDYLFKRGDHAGFLNLILTRQIFPEIFMFRTTALGLLTFNQNDLAYWAFTIASDLLLQGDVIFSNTPYYTSVVDYFEDEGRVTEGGKEVQYAWDRYRGGLEYFAAQLVDRLDKPNAEIMYQSITKFVIDRMMAAIEVRLRAGGNPLDIYFLARRLVGLGQRDHLPLRFNEIRTRAALWYLGNDINLTKNAVQILMVGQINEILVQLVEEQARLPVKRISTFDQHVRNSVCLISDQNMPSPQILKDLEANQNTILTELQLMRFFP